MYNSFKKKKKQSKRICLLLSSPLQPFPTVVMVHRFCALWDNFTHRALQINAQSVQYHIWDNLLDYPCIHIDHHMFSEAHILWPSRCGCWWAANVTDCVPLTGTRVHRFITTGNGASGPPLGKGIQVSPQVHKIPETSCVKYWGISDSDVLFYSFTSRA